MEEKFTVFLRGPLSQWARSKFTVDGIEYNCTEQYMMAMKAKLFGDEETQKAIMEATHPRDQKALGRKVKNFVVSEWEKHARDIVFRGNINKFRQNSDLKDQLLATKGTTLVEANPEDAIWGVALEENDAACHDRSKWKGRNWLGEVLTNVRETIQQEADGHKSL